MAAALDEARLALETGDVPVGASIVDGSGTVIATGRNAREATAGPHRPRRGGRLTRRRQVGRLVAPDRADPRRHPGTVHDVRRRRRSRRVDRIVYGAPDPKAGAAGSLWDVVRDRRLNWRPEVIAGVREAECAALLSDFFRPDPPAPVGSIAVESRSGRARTPRKRVRWQHLRGFKSHLHRHLPADQVPLVGALRLPIVDGVGQVGRPLRRLRADRSQGHPGRVHALEQADSGAEEHG